MKISEIPPKIYHCI